MQGRAAWVTSAVVAVGLAMAAPALATFSICACDSGGNCGVAIATNNLAVGATTIFASANTGVVVTQFESNPSYGPRGLALLARGVPAGSAVKALLDGDGNFEGLDAGSRQVAVVDSSGGSATYTGAKAAQAAWAGERNGRGYAVIGNGLAGERVLRAMEQAYLTSTGPLAARLMAALQAGEAAGGQITGGMSAAMLVRAPEGGFADVDLRVDAARQPVAKLAQLLSSRNAHAAMLAAERAAARGARVEANANRAEALRLAASWDRIWRRAARLDMQLKQPERALEALARFHELNPGWARIELGDPLYDPLRNRPEVQRWLHSE